MVDTLFAYPVATFDFTRADTDPNMQAEVARMGADGSLDRATKTMNINIAIKDFRAKYPMTWAFAGMPNTKHVATFATPFLLNQEKQRRENARDGFRQPGFQYPAVDPTAAAGINPAASKEASAAAMLGGPNKGFCLGYSHSDMDARGALYDLLDDAGAKPDILFIEEFPKELQPDIDAFLSAPNAPMSKALRDHARLQDGSAPGATLAKGWEQLLEKAQAKGISFYGLDSNDEASAGIEGTSALFGERRVALMNKVASDVMKDVMARPGNANKKFIAGMGAAHANTHDGGIPGLGQVMNVPVVSFDPGTGGLAPLPENPSLRRMPSKAEQAFIEAYISQVEAKTLVTGGFGVGGKLVDLGEDGPKFKDELFATAQGLAKRLADGGKLPNPGAVTAALGEKLVMDQQKAYVDLLASWPQRHANATTTARLAIGAGSAGLLRGLVDGNPGVLQSTGLDGRNLLHHAAEAMQGDCITELAGALTKQGLLAAQLGVRDRNGNTPMHACVVNRRDASVPHLQGQAAALDALIQAGGDPNATDATGRTPAHLAALNNNVDAMQTLHARGADFAKRDNRQWTPYDAAIGSTKVDAEQFFYANNIVANDPLVKPGETVDTVEALMRATRTEDPAAMATIRASYEKLYAIKELRPMLELVAADAMGPRDPANGGGARVFVAAGDHCGKMYAHQGGRAAPGGAYDEDSHVLMLAGGASGDFTGRLAHELTHTAARIVYGKDTVPFAPGSAEETAYRDAITKDVKKTAGLVRSDAVESAVAERMSGRMDSYVSGYPAQARRKLDQEFIVGVPQLMAQYGAAEVSRLAPNVTGFFNGSFTQAVKGKTTSLKLDGLRGTVDDRAIAVVPTPPARKPARVAGGPGVVASVVDVARASYTVENGAMPTGEFYSPTHMSLPKTEKDAVNLRLQRVQKALAKVVKEQGLPPDLSTDAIRGLAAELNGSIKASIASGASLKDFDAETECRAATWSRSVKLDYIQHCDDNAIRVPDNVLAEAVVIQAENMAWGAGQPTNAGANASPTVEVDAKKHRTLVADLSKSLGKVERPAQGASALVMKLSGPLAGDKSRGFYTKAQNGTAPANHVSIDKKTAKRTWLERLKSL